MRFRRSPSRRTLLTRSVPGALLGAAGLFAGLRGATAPRGSANQASGTPPPATPAPIEGEGRALWVNRFEFESADDIIRIMRRAGEANFNIVYFQARGAADAVYRSEIEPCSVGLCGRLGGTPPYDPLEVAVREANKHGLQVHAWLNALTGWASGNEEACASLVESEDGNPRHLLLEHPEYAIVDEQGDPQPCPNEEEYVYLSPAHAEVRSRLALVAGDIASRYDVAGIHLDRIRYPGKEWSYDEESLDAFGADPSSDPKAWDQFRRDLVNRAVRETFEAIRKVNPALVLSAAVWPIYQDRWQWNASQGYNWYFQDPRAWAAGGYFDVAVPMTYDPITEERCDRADWACLLDDHLAGFQQATGHHVYIGVAARNGTAEVLRAIALGRERGVAGFALYSYRSVDGEDLWSQLANGLFKEPAPVPPQPWKDVTTPATPTAEATPA
jgi:uncharacterized lipoprotein YddW (UPF0748 family)